MNIKCIYILEDRGILFISGDDVKQFLQNLISNDIYKVTESNSCFASLLTPQGKFLYDFLIIKHKNGYLIDCEKKQSENLFKQLNSYKLRSKIEIMNLSNEFVVGAFSREKFLSFSKAKDISGSTFKYEEDSILLDPRHKDLGARIIMNLEKLHSSLKKLKLKTENIEKYYKFSFKLGIPQKNMDELQNKLFGIECNFDELNGIDFKKGCFVGQENTARIKLRSKLQKRLLPIEIVKGKINIEDKITLNDELFGKVLTNNNYPFALIKFKNNNFDFKKEFNCGSARIKFINPNWIN